MRKLLYTLVVLFSMSLAANAQVKVNSITGKVIEIIIFLEYFLNYLLIFVGFSYTFISSY